MTEAIQKVRSELNVLLVAYVIMPEHVHLLVLPQEPCAPVGHLLAALKAPVSRQAKAFLIQNCQDVWLQKLTVTSSLRQVFRFWQPGVGFDKNLSNRRSIQNVMDYIHLNPARRGLVAAPGDWAWSSAGWYADKRNVVLPMDSIRLD